MQRIDPIGPRPDAAGRVDWLAATSRDPDEETRRRRRQAEQRRRLVLPPQPDGYGHVDVSA